MCEARPLRMTADASVVLLRIGERNRIRRHEVNQEVYGSHDPVTLRPIYGNGVYNHPEPSREPVYSNTHR